MVAKLLGSMIDKAIASGKPDLKWKNFADKHPNASMWIREGGLFVIVSNVVTVFKYLILTFLPLTFKGLWTVDFGWPGIEAEIFGQPFTWNIFGYAVKEGSAVMGGLGYFIACMIAMVIGEAVSFPIQRSFVFRSKRPVSPQIAWYVVAFCIVTVIVNSINCIWVDVAVQWVATWLYNIGTTVLNGGASMVVFFFVNKIIFPEGEAAK